MLLFIVALLKLIGKLGIYSFRKNTQRRIILISATTCYYVQNAIITLTVEWYKKSIGVWHAKKKN